MKILLKRYQLQNCFSILFNSHLRRTDWERIKSWEGGQWNKRSFKPISAFVKSMRIAFLFFHPFLSLSTIPIPSFPCLSNPVLKPLGRTKQDSILHYIGKRCDPNAGVRAEEDEKGKKWEWGMQVPAKWMGAVQYRIIELEWAAVCIHVRVEQAALCRVLEPGEQSGWSIFCALKCFGTEYSSMSKRRRVLHRWVLFDARHRVSELK